MAEQMFVGLPRRMVEVTIDGHEVQAMEGTTILDACRRLGVDTPTLCNLETLTPVNVCRVCVVELEGSRVLAQGRGWHEDPHGLRARSSQPQARARVSRFVGRHVALYARGPWMDDAIWGGPGAFWT